MKIKKLLSAVLVCAMVLSSVSLVAFADELTASTLDEWKTAVSSAADGDTIKLNGNIIKEGEDRDLAFEPNKNLIIDLNNNTLSLNGDNLFSHNVTFKNGTIKIGSKTSSGFIWMYNSAKLEMDNVTLNAEGASGYAIINLEATGDAVIKNSKINVTDPENKQADDPNIIYGGKNVTVENSQITVSNAQRGFVTISNLIIDDSSSVTMENSSNSLFKNVGGTINGNVQVSNCKSGIENIYGKKLTIGESAIVDIKQCTDGSIILGEDDSVIVVGDDNLTTDDDVSNIIAKPVAKIGDEYYPSLKAAVAAANNGDTIKIIGKVAVKDGDLPANSNAKTLTFEGGENAELTFVDSSEKDYNRYYANGSSLTFKNLIITWKDSAAYQGICHTKDVKYDNCTINGVLHLYGETETFTGCRFVQKAVEYNVWTYGAGVATFENCTFDSQGKSVLVYREGGDKKKVSISNCTFNAENPVAGKAAVEISGNNDTEVEITDSTASGFGGGSVSGSSLWNVKDGEAAKVNLTVDGNRINLGAANIAFIKSGASDVYDIYVTALDKINKLNSVDLTFNFEGTGTSYEITGANGIDVTPKDENRYMFSYKDGAERKSGTKIKIGTVAVTGFGEYEFKVVPSATNTVNATTETNNIVEYFDASGETGKGVLDIDNATTGKQEIEVPAKKLTINIEFPNAVNENASAYQDMKVAISGGTTNKTVNLGSDGAAMENGGYKIEEELAENTPYTVTVSGAGYRTARYTVTLNADKTLNFWNNVLDNEIEVEEGASSSAKKVTFLAGDIVKDNKINIYDLSAVVSYYGRTNDTAAEDAYAKYDLNRDGVIDSKDVAMVLVSWGN